MADRTPVADRRLSPFLLPTSTTTSFILLATLTVGIGATAFAQVLIDRVVDVQPCVLQARSGNPGRALAATVGFLDCMDASARLRGLCAVLMAVAVILALAVLHYVTPRWEIRRFGLQPLDPIAHRDALQVIEECLAEAGLAKRPMFLLETAMSAAWGRAFGSFGRHYVKLSIGLVRLRDDDGEERPGARERLRAVVRHELAHLVNRDIDVTGLSLQSTRVYLVVVAVPTLLITLARFPAAAPVMAVRLAVVAVLILAVRAALLRSREHDADVRASVWAVVAADDPFDRDAFPAPSRRRLTRRRSLPTHPALQRRADVVTQPAALLRSGIAEAFGTGVVVGAILGVLMLSARDVFANDLVGLLVLCLALGTLVVAVIGTGLWRATLLALADGTRLPSGVVPGLGLVLGLVAGDLVGPLADVPRTWSAFTVNPVLTLLMIAISAAVCIGLARWTIGSAATWMPAARAASMVPALRGSQAIGAFVWGAVLIVCTVSIGAAGSGQPYALALGLVGPTVIAPVQLALLAAVFSVFAAGWRRRPPTERRVWLDAVEPIVLPAPRIRPNLVVVAVLAVAVLSALVAATLLPELAGLLPNAAPTRSAMQAQTALDRTAPIVIVAIAVFQIVVFTVTALMSDTQVGGALSVVHGVAAAFLSGSVAVMIMLVPPVIQGCHIGAAFCTPANLWRTAGVIFMVNGSAALWCAIAIGPVVGVIGAVRRRIRDGTVAPRPRARGGRFGLVIGTLLTAAAIVPIVVYGVVWNFSLQPVVVAIDVRDAPPPGPPGSISAAVACADGNGSLGDPFSGLDPQRAAFERARKFAASTDPALRAFGRLAEVSLREGDAEGAWNGARAASAYCAVGSLVAA